MKRFDVAIISTMMAHALAWAAAIFLVVGPAYQGVSKTAVTLGAPASEPIRTTATLIEVNGLSVLPLLIAPVLLTASALLAAVVMRPELVRRGVLVLALALVLLGFCAVGIFSIGLFFVPAAIMLGVSGLMGLRQNSNVV